MLKLLLKENRIYHKEGNYFLKLQDYAINLLKDIELNQIEIIPEYEKKNLIPFLECLEDWNISRQIPWGTKIPLKLDISGNILYDENYNGDCLDTWFNSSLWIQACLQKEPNLLQDFYPATCIETGSDILFFWCARMLIMGSFMYDFQKELNINLKTRYGFKKIYLHGLIRDKLGRKFSKSLGNGIDPLEMITKYGTDALRLFLITRSGPSEDIKFDENQLHGFKKFINKIYQSGRFFSMYAEKIELTKLNTQILIDDNFELKKIQTKFSELIDKYQFLEASRYIQSIFKEWFCDRWIEDNKISIQNLNKHSIIEGILILNQMLAMLEPFCPYICYYLNKEFFNHD
jgi:valyl-tRNA synthetase